MLGVIFAIGVVSSFSEDEAKAVVLIHLGFFMVVGFMVYVISKLNEITSLL